MAYRPTAPVPTDVLAELRMAREEAHTKLDERIEKGKSLLSSAIDDVDELEVRRAAYQKWSEFNSELLKRMFTTDEFATDYGGWGFGSSLAMNASFYERRDDLRDDVNGKIGRLESISERLELIPVAAQVKATAPIAARLSNNKVFVVHGHDDKAKAQLEALLHAWRRACGFAPPG